MGLFSRKKEIKSFWYDEVVRRMSEIKGGDEFFIWVMKQNVPSIERCRLLLDELCYKVSSVVLDISDNNDNWIARCKKT